MRHCYEAITPAPQPVHWSPENINCHRWVPGPGNIREHWIWIFPRPGGHGTIHIQCSRGFPGPGTQRWQLIFSGLAEKVSGISDAKTLPLCLHLRDFIAEGRSQGLNHGHGVLQARLEPPETLTVPSLQAFLLSTTAKQKARLTIAQPMNM